MIFSREGYQNFAFAIVLVFSFVLLATLAQGAPLAKVSPVGKGSQEGTRGVCYGDLNNDNVINMEDISIFVPHYHASMFDDPLWWVRVGWKADFNTDGLLDLSDLSNILAHMDERC